MDMLGPRGRKFDTGMQPAKSTMGVYDKYGDATVGDLRCMKATLSLCDNGLG